MQFHPTFATTGLSGMSGQVKDTETGNTAALYSDLLLMDLNADSGLLNGSGSAPADGEAIASWTTADSGARIFSQGTVAAQPIYRASGINSKPAIDFDGTDDVLIAGSAFLTGQSGAVFIVYRFDSTPNNYQCVMSTADNATGNRYVLFYGRGNTGLARPVYYQNDAGTADGLSGSTQIDVSTTYLLVFRSSGTTISMRLNSDPQTLTVQSGGNNGNWFDDTSSKDHVAIGANVTNATQEYLNGRIRRILVYSALTDDQVRRVEYRLKTDAGIA